MNFSFKNSASLLAVVGLLAAALAACTTMQGMMGGESLTLSGANEVPPVTTSASGKGTVTVNSDRTVSGSITTSGINPTMAHIHEGAAGTNGPVIITLTKEGNNFKVPANAKLTEAQYASYKAGRLYVNVHSAAYPGGELRAQLKGS
jgi:predicted small secreted protein